MALVDKNAALCVKDSEAPATLLELSLNTIVNDSKLTMLSENIKKMGLENSAEVIAEEVVKLIGK